MVIGFMLVGLALPAMAADDPPPDVPDNPYFPPASPVWELGSNWVFDGDSGNGDGIASPGETVSPRVRIRNLGVGTSKNVTATLAITDTDITVVADEVTFALWDGGVNETLAEFVIDIAVDALAHDVDATVTIESTNDTSGDPVVFSIVIPVLSTAKPEFARRSEWIFDGTLGNGDGRASPGERVEPRVRILNDGPGAAQNVDVTLTVDDASATLVSGSVTHTSWPAGEARNNDGLILDVDAGASSGTLIPITVSITADNGGPWQFSYSILVEGSLIEFDQRSAWIFDGSLGNKDGEANPGERVEPRVRLLNSGSGEAVNVVATLSTTDADVTVTGAQVTHATWPAGVARNNTGFIIEIASDASAHDVTLTIDVTADNASPSQFTMTFPIVKLPASFSQRSSWAFDKTTGNGDGDANSGERVEIRARILNDGPGPGENVIATLTSADSDVSIVTGVVSHATWPVGEARNNTGFVVDVEPAATAHDVTFTLSVTADTGGPWEFTFTIPVVVAAVAFESRSFWSFDKTTGNADGLANPGERVQIRARMLNTGAATAENVVATLTSTDGKASVTTAQVTHATWPAGEARNNVGLVAEIDDSATGTAAFTLAVTADNGGPWSLSYTLTITPAAADFEQRSGWARDKVTGNDNGTIDPGEEVEVRARILNIGQVDATNVVATLSTTAANVTVTSATVSHATWPGGVARNNVGFTADLGSSLTASSVDFTLDVTADVGGPWQYVYTIPITGLTAPAALAVPGDIDRDGAVGIRDILAVAAVYGEPASVYPTADVNGDSVLDMGDMTAIHAARTDTVAGAPAVRHSQVTLVERWLREGRQLDDGSDVFREGLPALEALLAALKPATTALLPNYPNPFNPETWIPFDLAAAGEVTIRVYDIGGRVLRRLDLGYVEPGKYRQRDAAAYWDGRNEFGEAVASGVYLYEIRAGDQRDMRRMVVRK
ncbi:hypothetical protein CMK11_04570 [Candidatus Poribacteria bacterium]|nr:hypothetical protein [Candidatus Poribacteria bacterium]